MRPGMHAVYQLASVLEPLGLELRDPVPRLKIGRDQIQKPLLGFHPGSGSRAKNWPLGRWTDFIEKIETKFEGLLLIGGEADDEVIQAFRLCWRGPAIESVFRQIFGILREPLPGAPFLSGTTLVWLTLLPQCKPRQ